MIILLVVLLILALVVLPTWPHSAGWGYGYYPSGVLGIVLVVLLILLLTGRL
jgi:hypothetical protein